MSSPPGVATADQIPTKVGELGNVIDEGDVSILAYSNCQQRYYSDDHISHTISTALCFIGLNLISAVEDNLYVTFPNRPLLPWSLAVFLKDWSLDQYSL